MSIEKVGRHTYADIAYNGANVGCIITEQGMVLIDTLFVPEEILDWDRQIKKLGDKGVRCVINTHHHFDHVLGNYLYKDGAIIAHENCYRELIKPDGAMTRYFVTRREDFTQDIKESVYRLPLALPNITFQDRLSLHLGDVNLEVWHAGGHTDSSIYIYVVEDKVLFTGDSFQPCHPYMGQAHFREWLRLLNATLKMDVAAIVPGHHVVCGKTELKQFIRFLRQMWNRAKKLAEAGARRDEVITQLRDLINYYPLANPGEINIQKYEFDFAVGRLYDELTAK
ncbi:MAG: MBL fold metallo-hydrolase [Dehalococcoidales bacterium]|nr:MBL fold metallo-hydrolase [Dehalococcoidales bacterium]